MPENKSEQEPSIEEILASIRQIISDDDTADPAAATPAPVAEVAPAPVEPVRASSPPPAFKIPEKKAEEVLELTDIVEEQPLPEPIVEEEPQAVHVAPSAPPPPPPQPVASKRVQIDMREAEFTPAPAPRSSAPEVPMESILTDAAASATLEAFSKIATRAPLDRSGTGGVTIEDIVREMLRPMLREWIDRNLPPMVEKIVQKELDRLASKVDV